MSGEKCKDCSCGLDTHIHAKNKIIREKKRVPVLSEEERQQLNADLTAEQIKTLTLDGFKKSIQRLKDIITTTKDGLVLVLQDMKRLCPYYDYELEVTFAIEVLKDDLLLATEDDRRRALEETIKHFESLLNEFNTAIASDQKAAIELVNCNLETSMEIE
jgi:hypothetical protein